MLLKSKRVGLREQPDATHNSWQSHCSAMLHHSADETEAARGEKGRGHEEGLIGADLSVGGSSWVVLISPGKVLQSGVSEPG